MSTVRNDKLHSSASVEHGETTLCDRWPSYASQESSRDIF